MKSYLYTTVFLCIFFYSCSNRDSNDVIPGTVDVTNLENVDEIKFDDINKQPVGLYSDFFSDVRYVALQKTDDAIVGNIDKLMVTNNEDLLIFDYKNKSVLLFDSIGTYKNRIGVRGHSTNEYIEPLDVVYDDKQNQVIIYDNAKRCLMYYDMYGNYLNSIKLNEFIDCFEVLDDLHLVLYYGYKESGKNDINYNYRIIDKKGNTIKEYAPFDKTMGRITMFPYPFHKNNGKLFCHIATTPVVNEITLEEMKPIYLIDFGKYQLPNDYYIHGDKIYWDKVISLAPDKASARRLFQTDKYIFMNFECRENTPDVCSKLMITTPEHLSQPQYYSMLINDLHLKQITNSIDLLYVSKGKVYFECDPTSIFTFSKCPSNTDVSKEIAKTYRDIAKSIGIAGQSILYNNIAEVLERPTTSIIFTNKEKELLDSLSKCVNPIIQICSLKKQK